MDETTAGLEALISRYEMELGALSDAQLDRRPADGGWTAREVIAHLVTTVDLYNDRFRRLREQGPASAEQSHRPHKPTWVARLLLSVLRKEGPDKKKVKAPGVFRPGADVGAYDVPRLIASHRELIDNVAALEAAGHGGFKIPTPVSRFLKLAVCDAYDAQLLHGRRHLQQALDAALDGARDAS